MGKDFKDCIIMKLIPLTQGQFAQVDDADYDLVSTYTWQAYKSKNGYYAGCRTSKGTLLMHRLIMGVTDTGAQVDHADRETLNNQRYNLRVCTNSQNQVNRYRESEALGMKGTVLDGNKWRARITVNKKRINLGGFDTQAQAAMAYNEAAILLHGEFARLNVIK